MTKADIKSKLYILQQRCAGYKRKAIRESDDFYDYEYGKSVAYKDMEEWIEELIEKI